MSFELVSYHLSKTKAVGEEWIPVLLALSTACGIGASLVFGKLFDRHEMPVVTTAVLLSSLFSPLVFFGGFWLVLVGMLLWGVGYATQDSLFKALIAQLLPEGRRGVAFGLFYTGYGAGWLVGSLVAALLYERSLIALVAFAIAIQLAAIPIFLSAQHSMRLRTD
jgi:MFS family permease